MHWNQNHFVVLFLHLWDGEQREHQREEIFSISLWICEKIPQVLQANYLGLDSWKPLAVAVSIRISYIRILAYSFHKGSFSQPCGNPMACKSTLGYSAKSLSREFFKSMQGVIVCSKYNKVHSWWYNLIGFWLGVIQLRGSLFGNWGFKAKRLFHIRAWWAQQLRSTVMHLIQLSK